jgi:hypothetical protein
MAWLNQTITRKAPSLQYHFKEPWYWVVGLDCSIRQSSQGACTLAASSIESLKIAQVQFQSIFALSRRPRQMIYTFSGLKETASYSRTSGVSIACSHCMKGRKSGMNEHRCQTNKLDCGVAETQPPTHDLGA